MFTILQHRRWGWLLLLIAWAHPAHAWAHGGGQPHLYQVSAGPYQLTVWLSPEPPRAEALQIAVEADVANAAATGLDVQIEMHRLGQPGQPIHAPAIEKSGFFLNYYQSNVILPVDGLWDISITVTGVAGAGTVQFLMDVLPARAAPWELIFWSILAVGALLWAVWVMQH
ncbi:MAG: hypothetical protein R3A44_00955 [Caldilineaceae bacterium]